MLKYNRKIVTRNAKPNGPRSFCVLAASGFFNPFSAGGARDYGGGRRAKCLILDTHAGSAGSLVACRKAGLDGWGFEIDPVYYEKAMERLQAARDQVMMIDLIQEAQGAAR